jgi:HD-like signal output (HDOD) protein
MEMLPEKTLHGEEAFVAGLLHDVGKLIVDDYLDPEPGKRRVSLAEEADAVGLDHAELAEYILKQWRLPESIVLAIRDHHVPLERTDAAAGARVLQLAQVLVETWQIGHGEPIDLSPDFDAEPHHVLLDRVGLPLSKLPQVVWDVRQNLTGIESLYADD